MLVQINKALPSFLRRFNFEGKKKESKIAQNWDNLIQQALGNKFVGQSTIQIFKNDLLIVECLDSVWAQEFKFQEKEIIRVVNQYFGKSKIKRVKFVW